MSFRTAGYSAEAVLGESASQAPLKTYHLSYRRKVRLASDQKAVETMTRQRRHQTSIESLRTFASPCSPALVIVDPEAGSNRGAQPLRFRCGLFGREQPSFASGSRKGQVTTGLDSHVLVIEDMSDRPASWRTPAPKQIEKRTKAPHPQHTAVENSSLILKAARYRTIQACSEEACRPAREAFVARAGVHGVQLRDD
ncbi:hypothetical protein SAMN05216330_10534 [Bradyrhizobium sp. Ghvi]|nr:hypothetical protein SAMN05216330_10534 [Bradyrhizobium sp. Ghvi]